MNNDFSHFEGIKKAIDNNNRLLKQEYSNLYLLYMGFCNHLYNYMDAYSLLFSNKNYYVCRSIERAVIDLYIKVRVLTICKDPEKVAESIINEGKIHERDVFGEGKDNITDTGLCKYFDKIDNTYYDKDEETGSKSGLLEHRYKESCK